MGPGCWRRGRLEGRQANRALWAGRLGARSGFMGPALGPGCGHHGRTDGIAGARRGGPARRRLPVAAEVATIGTGYAAYFPGAPGDTREPSRRARARCPALDGETMAAHGRRALPQPPRRGSRCRFRADRVLLRAAALPGHPAGARLALPVPGRCLPGTATQAALTGHKRLCRPGPPRRASSSRTPNRPWLTDITERSSSEAAGRVLDSCPLQVRWLCMAQARSLDDLRHVYRRC
jgi:hypothetical protein